MKWNALGNSVGPRVYPKGLWKKDNEKAKMETLGLAQGPPVTYKWLLTNGTSPSIPATHRSGVKEDEGAKCGEDPSPI